MAIQLPKIQAENPVGPAAAPRIQAPALNTEAPMERQQQALEGVGKEIIRYRDQIANQEADNVATEADNKFQDWHKKRMYGDPKTGQVGLMYQEGDPKVNYDKFSKEAQDKLDELSSAPKDQDWSGLTQNVVNRRLNKRAEELHSESLTSYGHQKYEYDKTTMATNVGFAQRAMPLVSAQVDPDHPETFAPLQGKINDIQQPIISHALQYGGAVKTEDGSIVLSPTVKAQVAKAVSEGLYKTIDNLYTSDQGDGVSIKKANAIKQQFADQLDPFHKDSLSDKAEKAAIKQQSLSLAQVIMQKGPSAPEVANAPLEVKQNAMKFANEYARSMEQMKDRKQKANYDVAAKRVDEVMSSDHPFAGALIMKNDEKIQPVWDNLSAKQQQALEHQAQAPKDTSPAAQSKWLDLLTGKISGKTLNGMSKTDLFTYTAGMNARDQREAVTTWKKMNTQTGPQLEQQYNSFGKEFEHQAVGAGLVHKVPNSNILTAADQPKYENLKKELLDSIPNIGPTSPQQRSEYIAKFVADHVAGQAFTPPARKTFNGTTQAPPPASADAAPTQTPAGSPTAPPLKGAAAFYGNMTEQAKMVWLNKYRALNNGMVPKQDDLMKFIDKESKK